MTWLFASATARWIVGFHVARTQSQRERSAPIILAGLPREMRDG
jgi:hypothetical protein